LPVLRALVPGGLEPSGVFGREVLLAQKRRRFAWQAKRYVWMVLKLLSKLKLYIIYIMRHLENLGKSVISQLLDRFVPIFRKIAAMCFAAVNFLKSTISLSGIAPVHGKGLLGCFFIGTKML
jgi:hypothetical protein